MKLSRTKPVLREPIQFLVLRWLWRRLFGFAYVCWARSIYNVSIGRRSCWVGSAVFRNRGYLQIGVEATLTSAPWANPLWNARPCTFHTEPGARIIIGNNFSASGCCLIAAESIVIGDNVNLGANVTILDNDMHRVAGQRGGIAEARRKGVAIGDNVWIGANATILKGVTIGDRSVIGIGTVVRVSVAPDSVIVTADSKSRPIEKR